MAYLITLELGLFFLIGVFVIKFFKNTDFVEHVSIALAFGAMVSLGIFDLFPDLSEVFSISNIYLPIIGTVAGFLLLVALDFFVPEHEEHTATDYSDDNMAHIGIISSIAIILHNIIEGMAVFTFAVADVRQGMVLALGIGLHNIPMGMLIYSTLKSEKRGKRNMFILLTALSTFIGGCLMQLAQSFMTDIFDGILVSIALGMLIYIVAMELLPFLIRNKNRVVSVIGAALGIAIVILSSIFE